MKKKLSVILVAVLVTFGTLGSALAQTKRIVIGTAGTAGALYPMGVAMAETINRHAEGVRASAEATGASLENLRNLSTGGTEWGISANEVAVQAYTGQGPYEGRPITSLQSLFGTVMSWAQVFVLADSPIESIADFKGKRIGVGAPGSAGEQTAQKIIAHYGMNYDDIREEFMSDADMVTALQDGVLDAFITTHPLRSAPLLELTTNHRVRMISIDDDAFYDKYPFFAKSEVPAGTYRGIDHAVYTPTSRIVMYTSKRAGLSDEQVYRMIRAIWEHPDEWQDVHAAVKSSTTLDKALIGLDGIPLHPGALKYYREKGFEIPDSLLE